MSFYLLPQVFFFILQSVSVLWVSERELDHNYVVKI